MNPHEHVLRPSHYYQGFDCIHRAEDLGDIFLEDQEISESLLVRFRPVGPTSGVKGMGRSIQGGLDIFTRQHSSEDISSVDGDGNA